MTPREELIEAMTRAVIEDDDYWAEPEGTQNVREEQGRALDALLAHRDLLLEALGGERMEHRVQRKLVEVLWRFPVSEEAQT